MSIIGSLLNGVPKEDAHFSAEPWDIVMIPLDKIVPSPKNFYGLRGIEGLAQSIEEQGLKQSLTVHRIPDSGMYEIESGGRRYEALKLLVSQGNGKYELVPCRIETDSDEIMSEVRLIEGNARTRQLTDYEKVIQAQRLKELYQARKSRGEKIQGRTRDNMAKDLDISPSQLSIYESISSRLIPEAMAEFKDGKLDITAAYEASKLPAEKQAEIVEDIRQGAKVDTKTVKEKRNKPAPSPTSIPIAPPAPPDYETAPQPAYIPELDSCPLCGKELTKVTYEENRIYRTECKGCKTIFLHESTSYANAVLELNRRHSG